MPKHIFTIVLAICLAQTAKAQEADSTNTKSKKEATHFTIGKMRVTIEEAADSLDAANEGDSLASKSTVVIKMDKDSAQSQRSHVRKKQYSIPEYWGGLCIGTNGYLTAAGATKLPADYNFLELNQGKSVAIALNFEGPRINLYKRHLHLVSGLGFEWNNYRFTSDLILNSDSNAVSAYQTGINYRKNKITANYITAPLLIGYNTNPRSKKHFFIAAGFIGGLNIGAHSKQVFDMHGQTNKNKVEDDFNLEPFRYDATLRFGFRSFTLFANYSLSELFRSGMGPELHPFSFGIKLM